LHENVVALELHISCQCGKKFSHTTIVKVEGREYQACMDHQQKLSIGNNKMQLGISVMTKQTQLDAEGLNQTDRVTYQR
jgi:hypothetical protein